MDESLIPAASALIIHKGKILFIQRVQELARGKWVFPGGSVENDETFEDAAKREAKEEVGLEIKIIRLLGVYITREYQPNYEISCFVAESKADKVTPSSEVMDWKWLDPIDGLKLDLTLTARQALKDFLNSKKATY
ncbi:MAG: NUDIX hydrolase [Patescibacteria group bacterium]|nr:NUDIX hydrolase [Patescibacteria group bacterium]